MDEDGGRVQERTSRSRSTSYSSLTPAKKLLRACYLLDQNADLTPTMPYINYNKARLFELAKVSTKREMKKNKSFKYFVREAKKQIRKAFIANPLGVSSDDDSEFSADVQYDSAEQTLIHIVACMLTTLVDDEHFDYIVVDIQVPIGADDVVGVVLREADRGDNMATNRVFIEVHCSDYDDELQAIAPMLVACQQILVDDEKRMKQEAAGRKNAKKYMATGTPPSGNDAQPPRKKAKRTKTGTPPSGNLGKLYAIHTNVKTWEFYEIVVKEGAYPMAVDINGYRKFLFRGDPNDEDFVKDLKKLYAMLHYICNDINEYFKKHFKGKTESDKIDSDSDSSSDEQ